MKRFLLIFAICLLSVFAICAVACTHSAQAESMDGHVRYNAIAVQSPLKWIYNYSGISSTLNLVNNDRQYLDLGRSGSSVASLQNNVLSSSVVSTSGNYVYLDFKLKRDLLLDLVSSYNSYYGLSLSNKVTFTVNFDILSSYAIVQIWGRSSFNGSPNAVVDLPATASSGISSLTLDLDTFTFDTFSFLVQTYGSLRINGFKVEVGDNSFTGFVYDDFQVNGYTLGYNAGRSFEQNYLYNYNDGFVKASQYYDFSSSMYENTTVTNGKLSTVPNWSVSNLSVSFSQGTNGGMSFTSSSSGGSLSAIEAASVLSPDPLFPTYFDMVHSFYIKTLTGTLTYNYNVDGSSVTYICTVGLNVIPIHYNTYSGFNFSLSSNSTCQIVAYKQESGTIFTGFPFYSGSGADYTSGYNSGYSDGTLNGYNLGYDLGLQEGVEQGTLDGYSSGYRAGQSDGYNEGISTAQQGNFFALFSAIVDVPVSAMMSLLNYDFFGINMWDLARFVLTFLIFLAIFHFFTKGKLHV